RSVRRVGGGKTIPIDVRIIAATNRNLAEMTSQGLFREDLFYRLHVIPVLIPPLRERKSDIPLLADTFVQKICRQVNRPPLSITFEAMRALQEHD
ncbi:sigma 54-interacting transcriptional regulator, partial [Frankia sp. Cpl3]|nr:sigma 54-interacting transcriptional regulator [Frankia sp. Cpl3]